MSNETTPASSVMHIGDYLKSKREESKLSIEKVSQKTKINLNILRALEANDFKTLPSPAYVKGFVMSYARVLGLGADDVINKLEYSYLTIVGKPFPTLNHTVAFGKPDAAATPSAPAASPAEVLSQDQLLERRKRIVVPSLVFSGIVVIFIGLYQIVTKTVEGEANQKKERPYGATFAPSSELADINKPVKPEEPKPAEPKTEEVVAEAAPAKPAEVPAAQPKPEATVRRNFPKKDFRRITSRLFSVLPDAPENADETILPARIKSALNRELENVFIIATEGNTWLSYQVDGAPIESVILEKGKDLFLQGKEVLMFLGNVRVTKIFYQNRLIDAPTPTGFKSLIFPESRNSQHMLPLFPKAADDILYTAEEYQKRMKLEEEELGVQ